MVVAERLGVVNVLVAVPPAKTVPPEEAAYQSITEPAVTGAAVSKSVPAWQRATLEPVGTVGFTVPIVAVTAVRVADMQPVAAVRASAYSVVVLARLAQL